MKELTTSLRVPKAAQMTVARAPRPAHTPHLAKESTYYRRLEEVGLKEKQAPPRVMRHQASGQAQ